MAEIDQETLRRLAGWNADSCSVVANLPARGVRTFEVDAVRRGGRFELHGATIGGGAGIERRD